MKCWTEAQIRGLGVRTDLVTACEIVYACGRTKAYELLARDELDFPVFKAGNRYVVPTAPLRRLLELPPDMDEDRAHTQSTATTNEVTEGPRHDKHPTIRAI